MTIINEPGRHPHAVRPGVPAFQRSQAHQLSHRRHRLCPAGRHRCTDPLRSPRRYAPQWPGGRRAERHRLRLRRHRVPLRRARRAQTWRDHHRVPRAAGDRVLLRADGDALLPRRHAVGHQVARRRSPQAAADQPHRIDVGGRQHFRRSHRGAAGGASLPRHHDAVGAVRGHDRRHGDDRRRRHGGLCGDGNRPEIPDHGQFHGRAGRPADGQDHHAGNRLSRSQSPGRAIHGRRSSAGRTSSRRLPTAHATA